MNGLKRSGTGEAPGRIDFMGGVADYSGSLVLETPMHGSVRVTVRPLAEPVLRLHSVENGDAETGTAPLWEALREGAEDGAVRELLREVGVTPWARYPLGCLFVLAEAKAWTPPTGLAFEIESTVPQCMGVASSAALEIATLRALADLAGLSFAGTELAHLGQRAENRIVGAPCGLMDQLTCAFGVEDHLLPILCRPDTLWEPVRLPDGVRVVGWPSGVKHAVSGSPYGRARAAAFMGKKMLETHLGRRWDHAAEIAPSLLARHAAKALPENVRGQAFLERYGSVDDPLSVIDPGESYPVRAAVRFPIEETFRSALAVSLLRGGNHGDRETILRQMGELLLQSHEGYTAMGLGAPETDAMVDALSEIGPEGGIYGARTSGGGSGGTVVVLLREAARPLLRELARRLYFSDSGPLALIE